MTSRPLEYCFQCGNATGHAGRADDSLYCACGSGPFCRACYDEHRTYLGDSVYVEFDGYNITLSTDNGEAPENVVVLEPEVFAKFLSELMKYDKLISAIRAAIAEEKQ